MSITRREFALTASAAVGATLAATRFGTAGVLDELAYPNVVPPFNMFGAFGLGDVGFNDPSGIKLSGNSVWIADSANSLIKHLDFGGALLERFGGYGNGPGQLIRPQDIAVTASFVAVLDSGSNSVSLFSPDGVFNSRFGELGSAQSQFNSHIALLATKID